MSTAVNIPPQFEIVDRPLDTQMTISMGPQHPSTHGVLRLELVLDGEMVVRAIPDIGYLHTGMEKLFEYKKYQQGIVITDRMDYLNPLGNNLAYVMAVEKLLEIEIPERAQTIRVLMCELQRIASHLVWLGTHALDLGAMTVFFYCFREREKILNLIEAASGGRLTPSYFRIGGLMMDLPSGFERRVKQFLDGFPKALDDFKKLVTGNRIFQKRTQSVGYISAEDAIDWGLSGPSLRGSGVALDIRRANPYTGYEKYDFEIVTEPDGDVWARYLVRMREMKESHKIVTQALSRLKPGPKVDRRTKTCAGAFSRTEFCKPVGAAAHVARRNDRGHRRDYRIAGYCPWGDRPMICHRDTETQRGATKGFARSVFTGFSLCLCASVAILKG